MKPSCRNDGDDDPEEEEDTDALESKFGAVANEEEENGGADAMRDDEMDFIMSRNGGDAGGGGEIADEVPNAADESERMPTDAETETPFKAWIRGWKKNNSRGRVTGRSERLGRLLRSKSARRREMSRSGGGGGGANPACKIEHAA